MPINQELREPLLLYQRNEITEHHTRSVDKDESFKQRFLEMASLSLGVAGLSFVVGFLIREFLGVEI